MNLDIRRSAIKDLQSIKLYIEYRTTLSNFPESEVFLTKQALLESL